MKFNFEDEGLLYANCLFYILTINTKYFSLIKLCYTYAHSHSIFSFSFHFGWPNLPNFTLVIKIMTDCITLLHMSFYICCDFKTFHLKINHLKTILIKNNYPSNFIDSRIKSLLNKLHTPKIKLLFWIYLKEINLLSCHSWEVLHFKFKRSFKNCLHINGRLVIWKLFMHHPLQSTAFSPSRISYRKCSFQNLFTSISVVAAMLPFMVKPNTILKSGFVNKYWVLSVLAQ